MIPYGLLGKDISKSYSKIIHEFITGEEYHLFSTDNPLEYLKDDFVGFNVTIPYKTMFANECDYLSDIAKATNTVNVVLKKENKLYGYNTDAYGFEKLLEKENVKVKDKIVFIMGTGATSRTVKYVLEKLHAKGIYLLSRNPNNENTFGYDSKEIEKAEIIVNTTPVKDAILFDSSLAKHCEVYVDVIYNPRKTKQAEALHDKGIKTISGMYMLIAQAYKADELFFNKKYDETLINNAYLQLLKTLNNIVIIGHPCSGKSTIGAALAKSLNFKFVDTDELIETLEGCSITEIFSKHDEQYFRSLESSIADSLVSLNGYVISLGGGYPNNKEAFKKLSKNNIVINLVRPVSKITDLDNRPLTKNIKQLQELINKRKIMYLLASDYVIRNDKSISEAVMSIKEVL